MDAQVVKLFNDYGLHVSQISDFYSPLPNIRELEKHMPRWCKPSDLTGVRYNLDCIKKKFQYLVHSYGEEYTHLLKVYKKINRKGYGPGYPTLDAMLLYFMIRDIEPRRFTEIGSGVSTYYCSLAAEENAKDGNNVEITCIDPYPHDMLYQISKIEILKKEVQDVDVSFFDRLESRDILFIDSTHIVKVDGDVPYLYLEVIPRLKKGTVIHIHDIHFPYNIPYPPQYYIFGRKRPVYWNEAMLLQAFLSYNDSYKIIMSLPLLRYFDEGFLHANIPDYKPLSPDDSYTHSGSLWIEKIK
jgi:predicted O-methyltransferase YrrM